MSLSGSRLYFPPASTPLGTHEFQEHPEVAQHRAGLVGGDDLVPEALFLSPGELVIFHDYPFADRGLWNYPPSI